ncbi:hypothetical protein [Nocardia brevicatena]|uniref:hypothetical protein n=1 Tax=Nocardia brevicatena TaxID=37327 RepID=UPI0002E0BBC8|nr:hypothetical protein [Nocardia brevicatena]
MGGLGGGEAIARMRQAAKRLADALADRGASLLSGMHRKFPDEVRGGLERTTHTDERLASEFDRIGPAAHMNRDTADEHPESGAAAWRPVHGPDPTAEDGFLDLPIEEQIRRLEQAHGIRTDAERALELSLFMEDKFRDITLISRQTRPETIFDGPEGWASWLDARLFARRNLDREMSVDLLQEIHRRLRIRHDPENAGQLKGIKPLGWGPMSRPASRSELAAIEENPLLTYVPGPFRTEPHGVVLHPKVEGQPGAREVRWLDKPPTEEMLATIKDDPLLAYVEPGVPLPNQGVILYPNFGSVDLSHEFHASLCDRYNNALKQPGFDPHRSAAEFQKLLVSGHDWQGDFHGRHSRIAMNFLLEQVGRPPSAVAEFDNDLLTPSSQWADEVKAGSDRYEQWQSKLEQYGGDIDPVDLFELGPMMQQYQQMGEPSPYRPGELEQDTDKYERLHAQLRSGT